MDEHAIRQLVSDYATIQRESKSGKLWPSSLGGCMRQEMYRIQGYEQSHPTPAWKQWMFERFKWYETPFVNALQETKLFVFPQFPVENKSWSGRADVVFSEHLHEKAPRSLLEIKSISPWYRDALPLAHHLPQVWAYWLMDGNFHRAYLAYITRWGNDTGDVPKISVYDVTPRDFELLETSFSMETFEQWSKKEILPPRPYESPEEHNWNCTALVYNKAIKQKIREIRCPYFGLCWHRYVDEQGEYIEYLPF